MTIAALPILLAGCVGSRASGDLCQRLQDQDPTVRAAAAVEAGQKGRPEAMPFLVDRLDDSEETVRMVSIVSLEKLTGATRGYRYFDSQIERRKAIEAWRQWLAQQAATRPAGPAGNGGTP